MNKRIEEIKLNPSRYFHEPMAILHAPGLEDSERLEILTAWELDARALSVAADEGLTGGEQSRLQAVVNARLIVEARVAAEGGPSKSEMSNQNISGAGIAPKT